MTTDPGEDYLKKQFQVWLPIWFIEEWKVFVSRKWPTHDHGVLSLEVQLAMKAWMESEKVATHARKNTVLMEAENKPNFHTRKSKEVQVINVGTNSVVSESVTDKEAPSKRFTKYSGMREGVILLLERQGSISETKYLKDRQECICKRAVSKRVLGEAIKTVTGLIDYRSIETRIDELIFSGQFVYLTSTLFEVKEG